MTATSIRLVDLTRQYQLIRPEIDAAIAQVLTRADFVLGCELERFEEEFADYCQAAEAVGLDSGASALELGLRALGIGPGDDVLVPANSFIATATAASFAGARPVFVDVDPQTYTIDVRSCEERITPATRAVIPVHLYGQPADMDAVMDLAARRGLAVVEDACQAHGARYRGRRVGGIGHVGAFSFYPGKNLGAYGEAGALVTNDRAVAAQVRIMRNCGQREKYHHVTIGGNHRLDTLQAAVLRVKLRYLDTWNGLRRQLARRYDRLLAGTAVRTPAVRADVEHVYHLYVIQTEVRNLLRDHLEGSGIAAGIHYPTPIHLQPAYADLGYRRGDFPVAEQSSARVLSLPIFPELADDEVQYVAEALLAFLDGHGALAVGQTGGNAA